MWHTGPLSCELTVASAPPSLSSRHPDLCVLSFGLTPNTWSCHHLACGRRAGPAGVAHYYCHHDYDLCVGCASSFCLGSRGKPVVVPGVESGVVLLDSDGREIISPDEYQNQFLVPLGRRGRSDYVRTLLSLCRVYDVSSRAAAFEFQRRGL